MKVMSFNLRTDFLDINNRWKDRKYITMDIVDKYKCDVIGVQEMTPTIHRDMKEMLSDYNVYGVPRTKKYFVERNDIFVLKSHKVLESNTFWLSNNHIKQGTSLWYSLYPRICTTVLLELSTGEKLRIYNTHLDCFLPRARKIGFMMISEYIRKKDEEEKLPIILMGDFNAVPSSVLIKNIMSGEYTHRKLTSVMTYDTALLKKATFGKFKGNEEGLHIDYIFVSEEFKIIKSVIIRYSLKGKYPSDHYPIYTEILL